MKDDLIKLNVSIIIVVFLLSAATGCSDWIGEILYVESNFAWFINFDTTDKFMPLPIFFYAAYFLFIHKKEYCSITSILTILISLVLSLIVSFWVSIIILLYISGYL